MPDYAGYRYSYALIDALHRERLIPPHTTFPSVASLIELGQSTNGPALLMVKEVAARLGISESGVIQLIRSGTLRATRTAGQHWRIAVSDFADHVARRRGDGAIAASHAAQLVGLNGDFFLNFTIGEDAPFPRVPVVRVNGEIFVVEASVMAYIGENVTTGTAEDWVAMRRGHGFETLLTKQRIRKEFHTHERTVEARIADGTFPCLYTPGGHQARIPEHAVKKWHETRTGRSKKRRQPTPGQLLARNPRMYILSQDLAEEIGLAHEVLIEDIKSDRLRGMPLPDGSYLIERATEARAYRRRLARELDGEDYYMFGPSYSQ